ncbi:CDP-glycerol glycerophosphotransferase [Avibacterium sp. 20-126]|uniref:CDP-glycerol glycerophosphotransferase n=1 Tax=Avibacterium sp. 20-126 TaxID=2911524 RepID=UPI0021892BDB|nr:CDP-glycerol glycerophosphotransferase [Avibacterium sp. 20-126]
MKNKPYFIYLDSKIVGTAKQIMTFFENGIFPRENTTLLIKKYKHRSAKVISHLFQKANVTHRFVKAADLDALREGIIFYPFNAQSNCRAVANRNLIHIFITHGESSKISSVKPIIRIYDYVMTAGDAGIDRFFNHKIFFPADLERLITGGDTFVGKTGLSDSSDNTTPVIFYAPTWEGGIPQENYSSLSYTELVTRVILQLSQCYHTDHIVIRSHPNTGYRLAEYKEFLLHLIENLLKESKKLILFKPHLNFSLLQTWKLKRKGVCLVDTLQHFNAVFGLCDISAVETQLLNENIPYYLFCSKKHSEYLLSLKCNQYYQRNLIYFQEHFSRPPFSMEGFFQLKDYIIDNSYSKIPLNKRIVSILENL